MSEWQPANTAPKDGRPILGFRAGIRDEISVIMWAEELKGWKVIPTRDFRLGFIPTHWMPLPLPPSLAQRAAAKGGENV